MGLCKVLILDLEHLKFESLAPSDVRVKPQLRPNAAEHVFAGVKRSRQVRRGGQIILLKTILASLSRFEQEHTRNKL